MGQSTVYYITNLHISMLKTKDSKETARNIGSVVKCVKNGNIIN